MRLAVHHAVGAGLALAPTVCLFSPKAMTPLFLLTAMAGVGAYFAEHRRLPRPGRTPLALFGLALAVGVASGLWSVDPAGSLSMALRLGAMSGLGLLLLAAIDRDAVGAPFVRHALTGGVLLGLVLYNAEALGEAYLNRAVRALSLEPPAGHASWTAVMINEAATLLALMAWPVLGLALRYRRPVVGGLLGLGVAGLAVLTGSGASQIALAAGGVVFVAVARVRRPAALGLAAVIAAGILAAPLLPRTVLAPERWMDSDLSNSGLHRTLIWRSTADRIAERPWLGWGLNTSRTMSSPADQTSFTVDRGPDRPAIAFSSEPIPLHPHNAMLQWWLELGLPGALLGLAISLAALRPALAADSDRVDAAVTAGFVTATLAVWAISYGAWQNWWIGCVLLTAAAVVALRDPSPGSRPTPTT